MGGDLMHDSDRKVWEGMLAHLRKHHAPICRQWFEEIEPMGIVSGSLHLRAHSALHRDYLRRQCADAFREAACAVSERLLTVQFHGPDEVPPVLTKGTKPSAQPQPTPNGTPAHGNVIRELKPNRYESLVINPDYSFENFVVGPGNRLAHAAALAVAQNPDRVYNPFFIHGGVGVGKTHLLQAVCLRLYEANPAAVLYYTSCEGFMTQFFESVTSGEMSEFRHRFRDVDVLVIDDIHFLAKREVTQEEFFHTFNSLFQSSKQIILSSDAAPDEIPALEERLVSRFKSGLVAKVDSPTFETRVEIVKTKARLRAMPMPDDVACYIASRIDTNIRELEGAIVKLQVQASVENRPIDVALAKESLGEPFPGSGEPTIQVIIGMVTDFYGIRLTDLQSKHRQRSITIPRQVCMFLARRLTRHSLEEIGGYFGGRDHTTVMHAVRIVETRRNEDPEFDAVVRTLEDRSRAARGLS
jgi:chromosomal replication initiator protein